ncbi:MAG: prepilin peptidase [Candidatus Hydrothermae bacterium]|nr:prepilin peptidase [Candidatus Hydrothermae bacterium]
MLYILVFIFGAVVGSFINVCIYRIPRKESLLWPPSHCPYCGRKIKFYDNIPIVSYIILGGKCRYCGGRISLQYPLVEALTAFLFLGLYIKFRLSLAYLKFILLAASLVCISGIDLKEKTIPDIIVLPSILIGSIMSIILKDMALWNILAGIFGGAFFLFIVRIASSKILKREALGEGDITLIAMIGAYTGIYGVYISILAGSIVGSIVGIILLFKKQREIPFGPFLSMGAILAVFLLFK